MYGDVTLTAQWNAGKSTLTINPNGGTYSGTSPVQGTVGSSVEIADPTRTGYTFKGWSASKSYSGIYDEVTFDGTAASWETNYAAGYGMIGEANEYKFTDFITVNVWAYRTSWAGAGREVFLSCTNSGGWNMGLYNGNVYIEYALVKSGLTYLNLSLGSQSDLSAGWHMFTFTFDGMTASGYVDGVLKGSNRDINDQILNERADYGDTHGIFVGMESPFMAGVGTERDFVINGKIKRVLIENACASAADVAALYDSGNGKFVYTFGANNETLTANWVANTYKIAYDYAGGNAGANVPTSATYDKAFNVSTMAALQNAEQPKTATLQLQQALAHSAKTALGLKTLLQQTARQLL